jgi:hypothetical protein
MLNEPKDRHATLMLYRAMNRFRNFAETRDMAKWLESELFRLDVANRSEEVDVVFKQRQGACQVLEKLLSMTTESSEKINKLEAAVIKSTGGRH